MSTLSTILRGTAGLTLGLALVMVGAAPVESAGPTDASHPALRAKLARLIDRGGVAVGYDGAVEFSYGPGRYAPASILKLATALAALERLGPGFRFRTELYLDSQRNLIVKGFGDPFLISEEWQLIGEELRARGVLAEPLHDLVLDSSAFDLGEPVDGVGDSTNPYDARLGALVVNFNTINVRVARDGHAETAEPQTPLTALAREIARTLPPGEHRINLSRQPGASMRYTGELVRTLLEAAGARFTGAVRQSRPAPGLQPVLAHRSSRELPEVVQAMLKYSNNFIANQIALNMALQAAGEPARLEAGVAVMRGFFRERMGLAPPEFELAEGSGISRHNRVDLLAMLRVVDTFHPWASLLRPFGPPGRQVPGKTGNLQDVYTLAGFLPAADGHRRPFVVMLNQRRNTRNQVYDALYGSYVATPAPAAAGERADASRAPALGAAR